MATNYAKNVPRFVAAIGLGFSRCGKVRTGWKEDQKTLFRPLPLPSWLVRTMIDRARWVFGRRSTYSALPQTCGKETKKIETVEGNFTLCTYGTWYFLKLCTQLMIVSNIGSLKNVPCNVIWWPCVFLVAYTEGRERGEANFHRMSNRKRPSFPPFFSFRVKTSLGSFLVRGRFLSRICAFVFKAHYLSSIFMLTSHCLLHACAGVTFDVFYDKSYQEYI